MLKFIMKRRLRHPARRALRRASGCTVGTSLCLHTITKDYNFDGRANRINRPTLVYLLENDDIGVMADKRYDSLTCDRFSSPSWQEGAGEHCEAAARSLFNHGAFDWSDSVKQ